MTTPPRAPIALAPSAAEIATAVRALGTAGGGAGAARLLSMIYNPEVDLAQVRACLNGEPALAARVLKVANSPYYRLSGSVGTVDRATQLLGLTAIRGIAAAGCLDRLTPPGLGNAFDPNRFRRHSLAVACAAQQLSKAAGAGIDGEAFMAGLLHDIGLLLLAKLSPSTMSRFMAPALTPTAGSDADQQATLAAEREAFGLDHAEAGSLLVRAWSLPGWLDAALASHHQRHGVVTPPADDMPLMSTLLALADRIADQAELGMWSNCGGALGAERLAALGIADERLVEITQSLPDAVQAMWTEH